MELWDIVYKLFTGMIQRRKPVCPSWGFALSAMLEMRDQ